jgi:hypothetical protein
VQRQLLEVAQSQVAFLFTDDLIDYEAQYFVKSTLPGIGDL